MIKRTQGNTQRVIVPLFSVTLHEDGTKDIEQYTPQADDVVIATLVGERQYRYTCEAVDSSAVFTMQGVEVAGVYALQMLIIKADGTRMRYFTKEAIELTCETTDDLEQGAEFTASGITLDASWFLFAKGDTGNGIASIEKTGTEGKVDTYTINYTDGTATTFQVVNGNDGADGRGITNIKKISSAGLVDVYRINYNDGSYSLFQVTNGAKGDTGNGIKTIVKTGTAGLVDTYTITFTDGNTYTYNVTNGAQGSAGNGIVSVSKIATAGLVDTYRIVFTNGTRFDYNVTNGKDGEDGTDGVGIVSIEKTATAGLIDTYTITLTNGTTSTFQVTNGADGADGMQRVELVIDDSIHYKDDTTPLTFAQVLALVEDTTKFVTLYDGFNLYLPSYDDEGGAVIFSSSYIQNGSPQIMRVAINSQNQIKNEGATMEYANLKTDNLNDEGSELWRTYPTTHAVNAALAQKQHTLTAGENITIENNVISANGALRPLFIAAGAVYNSTTGYYEMNGLTDITEAEMMQIYNIGKLDLYSVGAGSYVGNPSFPSYTLARTNLGRKGNYNLNYGTMLLNGYFAYSTSLVVVNLTTRCPYNNGYIQPSSSVSVTNMFTYCNNLTTIQGVMDFGNITAYSNTFRQCYALESLTLKGLKANISFADSPNLSKESILYIINNSAATSAITITLHATAYAMAQADTEIQTALSNHPFVTLASA